jgi:hypothetical protein
MAALKKGNALQQAHLNGLNKHRYGKTSKLFLLLKQQYLGSRMARLVQESATL